MPSHRADTPTLRRTRKSTPGRRANRVTQRGQLTSLSGPQVGIASALGLATIAAPISGALSGPAPKIASNPLTVSAVAPAPLFPQRSVEMLPVLDLKVVPPAVATSAAPRLLTAPRTVIVTRASRAGERSVLPGCDGVKPQVIGPNGRLPSSSMCTLWVRKHRLRADAAVQLAKLNIAFKQRFGHSICITDSYRDLASQYRVKAIKGGLAARPGTSNHGLGLAVDLCGGIQRSGSVQYQWMRANGPRFGWDNPEWAYTTGPIEPWHFEYLAGE